VLSNRLPNNLQDGGKKAKQKAKRKRKQERRAAGANLPCGHGAQSSTIQNQTAIRRKIIDKCDCLEGSDYLSDFEVGPATTVIDSIKLNKLITPSDFLGTRVTSLSNLWERYRVRKFNIRYVPAVPTTVACQLLAYQDTDPLDDPTQVSSIAALVRQGMAQSGSRLFNFNRGISIPLSQRCDDQFYYTGLAKQNLRFNAQGKFYLVQVTNPVDLNGKAIATDLVAGSLFVDWEIEFNTPQINPSAILDPTIRYKEFDFNFPARVRELELELSKDAYVSLSKVASENVKSTFSFGGIVVGEYDSDQSTSTRYLNSPKLFTAGKYNYTLMTSGNNKFITGLFVLSLDADVTLTLV